jgi:hypothetical protein
MASFFKVLFSGRRTTVLDAGELGPLMTNKRRDGAEPLLPPLEDVPQPDIGAHQPTGDVFSRSTDLELVNGDHARRIRFMNSSRRPDTLNAQTLSDILRSSDTRPRLRVRHLLRVTSAPAPPRYMHDLVHHLPAMLADMERRGFTFELAERRR